MRILHGTWLNGDYLSKDKGFVLWAESSETAAPQPRLRRGVRARMRPHPYALSCKALRTLLLDLLPVGRCVDAQHDERFQDDRAAALHARSAGALFAVAL